MGPEPGSDRSPANEAAAREAERSITAVLRGLRMMAEARYASLAIAPGEYLADIYCIQRVSHLLAMELASVGLTLRRAADGAGEEEVRALEAIMGRALDRLSVQLDECALDLATATVGAYTDGGGYGPPPLEPLSYS